jgi:hypothetical protein
MAVISTSGAVQGAVSGVIVAVMVVTVVAVAIAVAKFALVVIAVMVVAGFVDIMDHQAVRQSKTVRQARRRYR